MDDETTIADWRNIIKGGDKSWVVFKHGTCVVVMEPGDDAGGHATSILKEWGPVRPGSSGGDFAVTTLTQYPGWLVTCHHPDILSYVSPEEVTARDAPEVTIGLIGRSKRDADAMDPEVLHIEDRR